MNTHLCKEPGCKNVIFGGADRCQTCRKSARTKRQGLFNKRLKEKRPLDLSKVAPEYSKYLGQLFSREP